MTIRIWISAQQQRPSGFYTTFSFSLAVEGRVLAGSTGEIDGGWQLPRAPRVVVDHDYVLAAAGLLAGPHPVAAYRLVMRLTQAG